MEAIQWNSQPVLAAIDTHLQRHQSFAQGCETVAESVGDVATVFAAADPDKVEQLRQAVGRLLEAKHRSQLQAAALQELKGSYEAGAEPTDFEAQLTQRTQQLGAEQPFNSVNDPLMRDFEMVAGAGEGEEEEEQVEQIDDDIAIEGGSYQLAPNATCPITAKQLLQIEEPVQDTQGVVYEHSAIVAYFRTLPPDRRGRAKIVAGSSHEVTLAELVPAERVIKEKRRQQRRQKLMGATQQTGAAADDVLDV